MTTTHIHTLIQSFIHSYIRTYIHNYIQAYIRAYLHTYMHIPTHAYTCMHACMHACLLYVCVYKYTHTHMSVYQKPYRNSYKRPEATCIPLLGSFSVPGAEDQPDSGSHVRLLHLAGADEPAHRFLVERKALGFKGSFRGSIRLWGFKGTAGFKGLGIRLI